MRAEAREHHAAVGPVTWIELSSAALRHNVSTIRRILEYPSAGRMGPGDRVPSLGAVVKSNAYGHGLEEMVELLHPLVDVLFVVSMRDAVAIRDLESRLSLQRRRLLVMGAISPEEACILARLEGEAILSGDDFGRHIELLREAGLRLRAHVHVDTGLGREGYEAGAMEELSLLFSSAGEILDPFGVCSHFANVEDVTEQAYAKAQLASFEAASARLEALVERRLERHIAASAAAMVLPGSRCDVVRAGISIYGLWPSAETRLSARVVIDGDLPELRPVLAWRCRPQIVKDLRAGSFVGYGCTWRASRPTRIAVLPVGYFDGFPRLASGKAHVLVHGERCPILGRVMMNHMVIDVSSAADCGPESVVTLLGADGGESLSAELIASWAQTINYEIVTRLGPHIERRPV